MNKYITKMNKNKMLATFIVFGQVAFALGKLSWMKVYGSL